MVHAWNDGMAALRDPKKSVALRGLQGVIAEAGFSAPDKPEPQPSMGRSPLLATARRAPTQE